jgi:hypothetical protein
VTHGFKVREEIAGQSRKGDARAEARHTEKRKIGQEGEEPQTGHRHRTLRSATRGRQGAVEEIVKEVIEKVVVEKVQLEEVFFEEIDEEVIEEIFEEVVEEELANLVPAKHRHRQECLCHTGFRVRPPALPTRSIRANRRSQCGTDTFVCAALGRM